LKVCWIGLFVFIAGCNLDFTPEPEKTTRAMIAATNDLADVLQSVHDADSARAGADKVDRKFTLMCGLMGKLPAMQREYANATMDAETAAELPRLMTSAFARVRTETERLNNLPGLPIEFWKVLEAHALDFHIKYLEVAPSAQVASTAGAIEFARNVQDLRQKVAYEELVKVDFTNMRADLTKNACDRLQKIAPGATLYHLEATDVMRVAIGPVKDFNAFASAVDFGDVLVRNESKRSLAVKVHRMKLGAKAETVEEEIQLDMKERAKESQREMEEQMARSRAEAERREAARVKEEEGDPSDPNYYDKLAELVIADDVFKRDKAVRVLLRTSPSQVTPEQRKKIARAFKQLVEDDRASMREEAIKGLVIWGGKYSGPILLRMLEDSRPFEVEHVIKALGDIKYAKAAPALAAKLGDFFLHQHVRRALRQMGEDAEDALLVVAPSQNPDICLAAIELLGDCGTARSLPLLRQGATARNLRVRDASKEAIRKIIARQKEAKTDDA